MATYKPSTNTDPTKATYGTSGADVSALQKSLNEKGASLALDGKYGPLTQAAYAKYGATTTPAPAPVAPTTTTPTPSPTSITSSKNKRPILYEDKNEPAAIAASSVEEIQQAKLRQAQGMIGGLNSYYDKLVGESKILGESNNRKTNAISALTGLSGGTEANLAATKTETANKRDLDKIESERNVAIQEILMGIQTSAVEEAKQQRLEARQSEQDRIAYREKAQSKAVENLTQLSKTASGATLEGLKETLSEDEYNKLVANAGGEAMASAILFSNRPKDQVIGTPQVVGGKLVQAFQTPDGKVKYENVDLPEGVKPDAMVEKTQNGLLVSNDGGNTWKKIFGPGEGSGGTSTNGTTLANGVKISSAAQNIIDIMNTKGGTVDDWVKGTSNDAQKLRNEVIAGIAAQGGDLKKNIDLFTEAKTVIDDMISKKDWKKFGYSSKFGGQFTTGYGDMQMRAAQVSAILARDNLGLLKGAMSDKDLAFIQAMSGGMSGGTISESYAQERMETIQTKLKDKIDAGQFSDPNISKDGTALQTGNTTQMTGPDGIVYQVPNDQVAAFKAAGGH